MASSKAIGIDLGTTYSCVAVYQHGKVEVITNPEGFKTTPSEVAFNDYERYIGNAAKNQGSTNPENTIFDVKRLIGLKFVDPRITRDIKNFPFKVVSKNEHPVVEVEFMNRPKHFTPEEVSAMVLHKMKDTAEKYLGHEVKDAVITVPAYFNDGQRQATKDAAKIARLNVLQIINEPTAAALAYGLERRITKKQNVLVFDLGGGTFDVTILSIFPNNVFKVLSTNGDTHLGGSDFDQKMLEYCTEKLKVSQSIDITNIPRSKRRLRIACEEAKRALSAANETMIHVEALVHNFDYSFKFSRALFERVCGDLFGQILEPVRNALEDAGLYESEIDEIVLVGGSTRIPKIQKIIKDFFNGKRLNNTVNPDEAVAYGAAIKAATLSGVELDSVENLVLQDVTPLSLGVAITGGLMSIIISRNAPIPVKKTGEYFTVGDFQTEMIFKVYEGERAEVTQNHKLGEFCLYDVPLNRRGLVPVDVTFEVNIDGILTVMAVERSTRRWKSVTINKGRLDDMTIRRMIENAEQYKKEDQNYRQKAEKRYQLEEYLEKVRSFIYDNKRLQPTEEMHFLIEKIRNLSRYLEMNQHATIDTFIYFLEQVKRDWDPIITNFENYYNL